MDKLLHAEGLQLQWTLGPLPRATISTVAFIILATIISITIVAIVITAIDNKEQAAKASSSLISLVFLAATDRT